MKQKSGIWGWGAGNEESKQRDKKECDNKVIRMH